MSASGIGTDPIVHLRISEEVQDGYPEIYLALYFSTIPPPHELLKELYFAIIANTGNYIAQR